MIILRKHKNILQENDRENKNTPGDFPDQFRIVSSAIPKHVRHRNSMVFNSCPGWGDADIYQDLLMYSSGIQWYF